MFASGVARLPVRSAPWLRAGATRHVPRKIPRRPLLSAADFDLSGLGAPELEGSVEYYQRELGAQYDAQNHIATFDGTQERLSSHSFSFIYDRRDWGLFRVVGDGAREFLHNKTTNSFTDLSPGEGRDTVFCTAKGRIKDLATAYVRRDAVLVILSPERQDAIVEELEKFVFPGDDVSLVDMRQRTRIFSLYGSASRDLLDRLHIDAAVLDGGYGTHQVVGFNEKPVIVAKGNEMDRETGFTLIVDDAVSGDIYKNFVDAGAVPIGLRDWETLRVVQGRPGGYEMDRASNPFELDLFRAVSLDKGCFLGQESISRVYTREAVRKRLWGIELPRSSPSVAADAEVLCDGANVGFVTSASVADPFSERRLALAILKSKVDKVAVDWQGKHVEIDGHQGVATALSYMLFDFPEGKGAPPSTATRNGMDVEDRQQDKEAKLKAMQERLAAYMKQQSDS